MAEDEKEPVSYYTIREPAGPFELKEKGSRFIAFIHPVKIKDDAQSILKYLRKEFHNATHVCFACRLGEGKEDSFRYNDDGEPSGTAGLPIYNEIQSAGYYNVFIAVVRYFGGIKLGTGGLARAYGRSARMAIEGADKTLRWITKEITLFYPHDLTGDVMHAVNSLSLEIASREYIDEGAVIKLLIPIAKIIELEERLADKKGGGIRFL